MDESVENYANTTYNKIKRCTMLFSELRCKEVINIKDCKKLGRVQDIEFNPCNGCIEKIFIPACCGKWGCLFPTEPDYVICFNEIKQIGPDIILVDVK